jgi:hypothetical protein
MPPTAVGSAVLGDLFSMPEMHRVFDPRPAPVKPLPGSETVDILSTRF